MELKTIHSDNGKLTSKVEKEVETINPDNQRKFEILNNIKTEGNSDHLR